MGHLMNMKHDTPMKTLGAQAAHLVTSLYEENKNVFHLEDVRKILGLSDSTTRNLVRNTLIMGVRVSSIRLA